MQIYPLIHAVALTSILSACSGSNEPQLELYRGTMQSSCAPHDALSTALELQQEKGQAVASFNLWPESGVVPPANVEFDETHPVGQGAWCSAPGDCRTAEWGRVVLRASTGGSTLEGEWALGFADGSVVRGRPSAEWLAIQAMCG